MLPGHACIYISLIPFFYMIWIAANMMMSALVPSIQYVPGKGLA
jgi:hypothetical protein